MVVYAENTAARTVARARQFTSYSPQGYCANYVSNCVSNGNFGYGISSAIDAWRKATHKHTTGTPPAGAPVYWGNGVYGHIAISVGGGKVRSTDYPALRRVGETDIHNLENYFGMAPGRYLGWSSDLAGRLIYGLQGTVAPTPAPSSPSLTAAQKALIANIPVGLTAVIYRSQLRVGKRGVQVSRYQAALWNRLYNADRLYIVKKYGLKRTGLYDGIYDAAVAEMTRIMYRHMGLPEATGPGPMLMDRLGFKNDRP